MLRMRTGQGYVESRTERNQHCRGDDFPPANRAVHEAGTKHHGIHYRDYLLCEWDIRLLSMTTMLIVSIAPNVLSDLHVRIECHIISTRCIWELVISAGIYLSHNM